MGAIVAAAWAFNPDHSGKHLLQLLRDIDNAIPRHLKAPPEKMPTFRTRLEQFINVERFILGTVSGWSVLPENLAKDTLEKLTLNKRIEDATLPLAIVAVDLLSGRKVVFRSGAPAMALQASSAIPGYLPPVRHKDMLLVDGAIIDEVPVDVVRGMDVDVVIGVDVEQRSAEAEISNGLEAFLRAVELCARENKQQYLRQADLLIHPRFGETVVTFDVSKIDLCIEAGKLAAEEALPAIRELLARRVWRRK
jgi:predicted acylesterase/phospholipase RssA